MNIQIKKNRIRFYFYIGTILPVVVFMFVFTLTIFGGIKKEHIVSIDQLSESIMTEKKLFIQNTVEQTIYIIESALAQVDSDHYDDNLTSFELKQMMEGRIRRYLHGLKFIDADQYVWINEIINYEGGDNYARRLVHPNLPETEGSLLSTLSEDINGNKPYETELNGINESGALFYDYYFKRKDSSEISHKLSYAKLYRPFNWIVATGIYLEDLESYINVERQKLSEIYNHQKQISRLLIAITMFFTAVLIFLFEKSIGRLVHSYEQEIEGYTKELEILSTTDRLTGLSNRLFLDGILEQELAKSKRYQKTFSIILFDIDRFKKVNDTFGHQNGDKVLVEVAELLRNSTRTSDVVGRWGGEEFLIICMESGLQGAVQLAESLRQKISDYEFSNVGTLTRSFGVSCFHEQDSTINIVERADRALYRAKGQGRDRVAVEDYIRNSQGFEG